MAAHVDRDKGEEKVLKKSKEKLQFYKLSEGNGVCHLYDSPPSANGYITLTFRHPGKAGKPVTSTTVAKAAQMVEENTLYLDGELEASHLCHNKTCVLIEHISYEPHTVNAGRKACVLAGACLGGHGQFPHCLVHLRLE